MSWKWRHRSLIQGLQCLRHEEHSLRPGWAIDPISGVKEGGGCGCVLKKKETIQHYNLLCIFTSYALLLKMDLALQVWILFLINWELAVYARKQQPWFFCNEVGSLCGCASGQIQLVLTFWPQNCLQCLPGRWFQSHRACSAVCTVVQTKLWWQKPLVQILVCPLIN